MFSDDDDTIEYDSPARRSAPVGAVSGGAGILAAAACGGRCACAEGRRRAGGPFPGDEGLYGDLCGRRRRLCRRRKLCRRGRPLLHARGRCRGLLRRRFEMGGRSRSARWWSTSSTRRAAACWATRRGRSISWTTPSAANCCPPKARCAVCGSRRSTRGRR